MNCFFNPFLFQKFKVSYISYLGKYCKLLGLKKTLIVLLSFCYLFLS